MKKANNVTSNINSGVIMLMQESGVIMLMRGKWGHYVNANWYYSACFGYNNANTVTSNMFGVFQGKWGLYLNENSDIVGYGYKNAKTNYVTVYQNHNNQ